MFRLDKRGMLQFDTWQQYNWLKHGFTTRLIGDFSELPCNQDIAKVFGADTSGIAILRQVHSSRYLVEELPWSGERPEGDAVLTNRRSVLVGVRTADCLPVLLLDPATRAVAAVHAGWRGVVSGVLPRAIDGMKKVYGSNPKNLEVAIGPGINACCFEVGEEVAANFLPKFVIRDHLKPHVDLVAVLQEQLNQAGIGKVMACGECTHCDTRKYHSHRAEKGKAGRMLAAIGVF